MTNLKRDQLTRALQKGELSPLYLLFGPEDYLRGRAACAIADAALRDAAIRDFNESSFSLQKSGVHSAIAAAEQLPMMAPRRVVRMTDFSKLRDDDEEALLKYIKRPAESSVVIFVAGQLDKRLRLSKSLRDACVSVEFTPLEWKEMTDWARAYLKELGVEAEPRVLNHLIALTGESVGMLANEIEKLATAALPEGRITMKLVDALVGRSRVLSNFDLTDRLIGGERSDALRILHQLLDDGAEPVMLIGLLASNYHRLALAKELMDRNAPNPEVNRVAGMPWGKQTEFLAMARRSDLADLARSIKLIAEADLALKTSRGTPRLQMEVLVCELAGKG